MILDNINLAKLETPCFILDYEELHKSLSGFKSALNEFFPKNILSYSVKTNSLPFLLEKIKNFGCYAEVVSYDEYDLAKKCGFPINKIIYNGPLKSKETFIEAIEEGAIVNIETKREIRWLMSLPKDRIYRLGVRLNINLDKISPNDAKEGEGQSRFGYNEETGEFKEVISTIQKLKNIKLTGIHVHRTSKTRSLGMYRNLSHWIIDLIKNYNLNLEYIDIGGGYYGIMENKPTYGEYAETIYSVFNENLDLNKTAIVIEPGNAIVASCFAFLSTIIDEKNMGTHYVYTTDGSRIDIDPFFHKKDYFKEIIYSDNSIRKSISKQIIGGCTCLENDKLFILSNHPKLKVNDRILYKSVGAYTMTLTSLFIRYFPKVYLKQANNYTLIRESWNAAKIIQKK